MDTAKGHSSRHSLWDTVVVLAKPAVVMLAVNGFAAVGHLSLEETRSPFHSIGMDSTSSASSSWFISSYVELKNHDCGTLNQENAQRLDDNFFFSLARSATSLLLDFSHQISCNQL